MIYNKYLFIIFLSFIFSFNFVWAKDYYILIRSGNGGFWPKEIVIKEGDIVYFRNFDNKNREIYSDDHPEHNEYTLLNIGDIKKRTDVKVVFDRSGIYSYHDHSYPRNTGKIIVIDDIAPANITDLSIKEVGNDYVILEWTDTGDNNIYGFADHYQIFYANNFLSEDNLNDAVIINPKIKPNKPGEKVYFKVDNLKENQSYYFLVKIFDEADNFGISNTLKVVTQKSLNPSKNEEVLSKKIKISDYFNNKNNIDLNDEDIVIEALLNEGIKVKKDINKKNLVLKKFQVFEKNLDIINFLNYGFDKKTNLIGLGQRGSLIFSFLRIHNKYPKTQKDWSDIIKIANGQFPKQRNLDAEKYALKMFQRIYKRNPDFRKKEEEKAIWYIAYGIHPSKRDLDKEEKGIYLFVKIFKKNPISSKDWDIVRALSYSNVEGV